MNNTISQLTLMLALLAVSASHAVTGNHANHPPVLAAPTLEIDFPFSRSLIQFFYIPRSDEDPTVEVYLSYRSHDDVKTIHLETIEPEGRAGNIESAFTLDADKDRKRELFIIASWPISHPAIGTEGTLYKIYVYRSLSNKTEEPILERAKDIESKLGSGLDGTREGVKISFPYKDYASIRSALAR